MDEQKPSPYGENKQPYPNNPEIATDALRKIIQDELRKQLQTGLFTARKLTDTPTDSLQVVNRMYVTMNGISANRPTASVIGQRYFDTTLASGRGKPIWYGPSGWVDATGTLV